MLNMTKTNYQAGLLITGDARGAVKSVKLTRSELANLATQQKKTKKTTRDLAQQSGNLIGKIGNVTSAVTLATATLGGFAATMRTQTITEMKVMADTLNISTQALSEWTVIGEKFNVQGDKMADIFKDIQDKIGDFASTGGGEAKDVFEKLNIDINDLINLSADQQLLKIGSALENVNSHGEKIFFLEALANDASRLLPLLENNAQGLRAAQEEARLLGTSISDIDADSVALAGREFQRTQDLATGLTNELTIAMAPALADVNSRITDAILEFGGWAEAIDDVTDSLAVLVGVGGGGAALVMLSRLNVNLLTMGAASATATQAIFGKVAAMRTSTLTTNAYGQVIARTTAKTTAQTLATRALTVATRTLLGPIGLAVTAGYLLYEAFSPDELNDSTEAVTLLEAALGKAAKAIDEMTLAEQRATAAQYDKLIKAKLQEITDLEAAINEQKAKVKSSSGSGLYNSDETGVDIKNGELVQLENTLENLKNAYSDVQGAIFDAGMANIQWNKVIVDGVEVSNGKVRVVEKELTANQKLISLLGQQIGLLQMTDKHKAINTNLSKLSADATQEEINAVRALSESLFEQQEIQTKIKEDHDFYQDAIDGVNGYSDAWSSAGNVIIDTFGSIGQQMEKLFSSQDAYTKAIEINHKKQQVAGADIGKLKKEEYALNRASAQSEINSYGSIAGAAASMFNEKSKAAKTFHAIEQVMAVASLAMSVQKMVMSTTETGAHVANESTKQEANALTAITSAFAAPFPVGFAAGAAMIGIMASLIGGSFGSSGSAPAISAERQKTQGTGTVLGSDEKSQSILNAYGRIEALELDQYAELRQMNDSLHDLNNNITHLATSLVSNFGRFNGESYSGELGSRSTTSKIEELLIGGVAGQFAKAIDPTGIVGKIFSGFSSKKKSLVDSGISIVSQTMGDIFESGIVQAQSYYDIKTKKKKYWGASSKTSYSTEFENVDGQLQHELALVFSNIGDSINSAVDVLGLDITKNLDNFVIDLPNISLKDLSGDEVKAELEAIFSSQSDLMATYLVPSIIEYQQVGEGLFDTLIRVAQEQAIFNSAMENIGKTLAGVSTEIEIGIAQSLVVLMGGIESFSESTNAYFAAFFSDEEKFSVLQKQLTSLFKSSSAVLPETRKEFRALVDALDLTTQSGQKAYASLVKLSPQLDEYYAQIEALESDRQELFAGILSSLGDSLSSTIGEYLNSVNSEVNAQIRTEQQRINEVNREVKNAYKEQLSAVNALHNASQSLNTLMQSLLLNDLSTLNPLAKFDEAQSQFDALFERAENGDVDAANSLGGAASTLLTLGKNLFASSATYKDLFVDVNNQLSTVADITGAALAPTESDELTSSALLEQLNNSLIVEEAVSQSELLGDILTQLQSVAFATGEDVTTLAESMGLDLDQLPADIRAQIETIGLALDATMADINFADSIDSLGDTLADNFALSIGDIDTNVDFTALITAVEDANDYSSLNTALTNLETAVATVGGDVGTSLAPWFGNSALANDIKNKLNQLGLAEAEKQDAYIASLADLELNLDIEIPINGVLNSELDLDFPGVGIGSGDVLDSYDKGTSYVPHDQIAQIHQGEIIIDPQSSAALRKYGINVSGSGGDNKEVVTEIKNLNSNIERLIIATEKVEKAADSKQVIRELKNNRLVTKTRKFG